LLALDLATITNVTSQLQQQAEFMERSAKAAGEVALQQEIMKAKKEAAFGRAFEAQAGGPPKGDIKSFTDSLGEMFSAIGGMLTGLISKTEEGKRRIKESDDLVREAHRIREAHPLPEDEVKGEGMLKIWRLRPRSPIHEKEEAALQILQRRAPARAKEFMEAHPESTAPSVVAFHAAKKQLLEIEAIQKGILQLGGTVPERMTQQNESLKSSVDAYKKVLLQVLQKLAPTEAAKFAVPNLPDQEAADKIEALKEQLADLDRTPEQRLAILKDKEKGLLARPKPAKETEAQANQLELLALQIKIRQLEKSLDKTTAKDSRSQKELSEPERVGIVQFKDVLGRAPETNQADIMQESNVILSNILTAILGQKVPLDKSAEAARAAATEKPVAVSAALPPVVQNLFAPAKILPVAKPWEQVQQEEIKKAGGRVTGAQTFGTTGIVGAAPSAAERAQEFMRELDDLRRQSPPAVLKPATPTPPIVDGVPPRGEVAPSPTVEPATIPPPPVAAPPTIPPLIAPPITQSPASAPPARIVPPPSQPPPSASTLDERDAIEAERLRSLMGSDQMTDDEFAQLQALESGDKYWMTRAANPLREAGTTPNIPPETASPTPTDMSGDESFIPQVENEYWDMVLAKEAAEAARKKEAEKTGGVWHKGVLWPAGSQPPTEEIPPSIPNPQPPPAGDEAGFISAPLTSLNRFLQQSLGGATPLPDLNNPVASIGGGPEGALNGFPSNLNGAGSVIGGDNDVLGQIAENTRRSADYLAAIAAQRQQAPPPPVPVGGASYGD